MSVRRATGYLPDPPKGPGERPDFRLLLSTASPVPKSVDNRDLIVEILDQGNLGSCTANAIMQAIRASHVQQYRAAGQTVAPPLGSRLWLYYLARRLSGDTQNDVGTFLRFAFQTLNEHGFCPEYVWPYEDKSESERWRQMPSKQAMRAGYDQKVDLMSGDASADGFAYYRIYETGDDRVAAVKRALAGDAAPDGGPRRNRNLVVFGTDVTSEFMNGEFGTQPTDPTVGHKSGGHAMCAVDFENGLTEANDVINCASSWTKDWANGGYYSATRESVYKWRDVWVVKAPPLFSEARA